MLTKYFEAKIGSAIYRRVTSGNNCFVSEIPYSKQYKAEILDVDDNLVTINVTVTAICPSGATDGSFRGRIHLGDHQVTTELPGLETLWLVLLSKADPDYAKFLYKEQYGR